VQPPLRAATLGLGEPTLFTVQTILLLLNPGASIVFDPIHRGRVGRPEELAAAVLFLASGAASSTVPSSSSNPKLRPLSER